MKSKTWLADILEDFSYKYYLENYPFIVEGIKTLLVAGEKPFKIKKYVEGITGKSLTGNTIALMIDYVNKQVKN